MSRLFVAAVLAVAFSFPALGETVTGTAASGDELSQVQSKWKYHMSNTARRYDKDYRRTIQPAPGYKHSDIVTKKGKTYGTFFWCVNAEDKSVIRYAYTYGEPDREQAEKKAAYALDSMGGKCLKRPVMKTLSADDL